MHPEPVVRILIPAPHNLGPGKVRLLEAIRQTGSISGAARQLHISYRRAWGMLDSINQSVTGALVETSTGGVKGGGARLTARGEAVLLAYRELESRVKRSATPESEALMKLLDPD